MFLFLFRGTRDDVTCEHQRVESGEKGRKGAKDGGRRAAGRQPENKYMSARVLHQRNNVRTYGKHGSIIYR